MPLLSEVPLDKEIETDEYRKELKERRTGLENCTTVFTGKKYRSSSLMRAGMQQEKAATSSGLQEHLIRAVTKFIRSQARNLMRKQDITCGVSDETAENRTYCYF